MKCEYINFKYKVFKSYHILLVNHLMNKDELYEYIDYVNVLIEQEEYKQKNNLRRLVLYKQFLLNEREDLNIQIKTYEYIKNDMYKENIISEYIPKDMTNIITDYLF